MGIDPRIILGISQPNIQQRDPLDEVSKVLTLKHLMQQGELGGLQQTQLGQKISLEKMQLDQLRETQPLTLEGLRIENARKKRLSALIGAELGDTAEGAPMGAGGGVSATGGTQGMPPLPANVPTEMQGFAHDLRIAKAISLDDPAKGRALMEAVKLKYPEIKWEGGIPLHPRTGQRMASAPIIPHVNQQGFATTANLDPATNQVSIGVTPGAADAYSQQQRIGEKAKADFDLITRPSTSPGAPPTYISRSDALGGGPASTQPAAPVAVPSAFQPPATRPLVSDPLINGKPLSSYPPAEQAGLRQALAQQASGQPVNVAVPADASRPALNNPLVPGIGQPANAAGLSPNQGALVKASETAMKEFIDEQRKNYAMLRDVPAALENIERTKALVPSAKGFMGPGGETLLTAASFLNNRLGTNINIQGTKDANEVRTRIFTQIMDNLKKLDAQPSQQQQQVMQDALGKLGTDPNALPQMLDAYASVLKSRVAIHNSTVNEAEKRGVMFPHDARVNIGEIPTPPPPSRSESSAMEEEVQARRAIAKGANRSDVAARYKQRTGRDLP